MWLCNGRYRGSVLTLWEWRVIVSGEMWCRGCNIPHVFLFLLSTAYFIIHSKFRLLIPAIDMMKMTSISVWEVQGHNTFNVLGNQLFWQPMRILSFVMGFKQTKSFKMWLIGRLQHSSAWSSPESNIHILLKYILQKKIRNTSVFALQYCQDWLLAFKIWWEWPCLKVIVSLTQ